MLAGSFLAFYSASVSIQILRPKWTKRLFSSGGDAGPGGGGHGADGCGDIGAAIAQVIDPPPQARMLLRQARIAGLRA